MDKMIIINVSGNVDVDFFHLPFNNKLGRENFSILYRYMHEIEMGIVMEMSFNVFNYSLK